MKAVVQRVREASVEIDNKVHPVRKSDDNRNTDSCGSGGNVMKLSNGVHAQIGQGYLVLLGIAQGDDLAKAEQLAGKIAALRIFEDKQGKMNCSLNQINGQVLVVSQFTLCANLAKGNRPSFEQAAPPETARKIYQHFVESLNNLITHKPVQTGLFGARMQVKIQNDGPVTMTYEL